MVGQAAIVVMETQVGGAHLAHPQLLLLEDGGWHGVSVYILQDNIPLLTRARQAWSATEKDECTNELPEQLIRIVPILIKMLYQLSL